MNRAVLLMLTSLFASHASVVAAKSPPASPRSSLAPRVTWSDALKRAIAREETRDTPFVPLLGRTRQSAQTQNRSQRRHWCSRHPIACGSLIGLGAGFALGVATNGDRDYAASANGLIYAGIGAGIGAATGGIIAGTR